MPCARTISGSHACTLKLTRMRVRGREGRVSSHAIRVCVCTSWLWYGEAPGHHEMRTRFAPAAGQAVIRAATSAPGLGHGCAAMRRRVRAGHQQGSRHNQEHGGTPSQLSRSCGPVGLRCTHAASVPNLHDHDLLILSYACDRSGVLSAPLLLSALGAPMPSTSHTVPTKAIPA